MTDNCTCADHGTFITTDPACPIHGTAEMERRHQRALLAARIRRETGLAPADVQLALREGCRHD